MPRPLVVIPVDRLPLVGGRLCLDFVNTTGARASASPRERLTTYRDLVVWSQRAGILPPHEAAELRTAAGRRPGAAARALARAHAVRETLYALFVTFAEGRRPDRRLVRELGREWRTARERQELAVRKNALELRFVRDPAFDRMFAPIVISAVDLLTSDRMGLVKRCGECDWLFVDGTKAGTRRWCKPMCGNRARSRARYRRRRRPPSRRARRSPRP